MRTGAAAGNVPGPVSDDELSTGPLQLLLVGFESTAGFRGDIAREIATLRGRGMIRVLDARLFHRGPDDKLTEVDLNPLLADPPPSGNPLAHLLGTNGGGSNGGTTSQEAFHRTVGFALEDLRRLTDEIGPGEYAAVVLIEHIWAATLRETVREAGGRLLGQGFLTPEVVMIVGAEIQARAEAQAAIELAEAARGSALVEALGDARRRASPARRRSGRAPPRRSSACSSTRGSSTRRRRATPSTRWPPPACSSRADGGGDAGARAGRGRARGERGRAGDEGARASAA